jgi:hypothetical protein
MKQSTIKVVMRKKLGNWLETLPEEYVWTAGKAKNTKYDPAVSSRIPLRRLATENVLVCGGAIVSMLQGEKPNDYDLYMKDYAAAYWLAQYYADTFNAANGLKSINNYKVEVREQERPNIKNVVERRILMHMQSAGIAAEGQADYTYFEQTDDSITEAFMDSLEQKPEEVIDDLQDSLKPDKEKSRYRPVFITDNAVTLSDKVQLIVRFYGMPDKIFENFDYAHARCHYDLLGDKLVVPPDAMQSIMSKSLVYEGSLYPIASLFRIRKFIKRGWRITAGQMLKMVWDIKTLDLDDPKVLRDQLIGVDQAYMTQLINALQDTKTPSRVDSAYIAELVDRIFEE